MSVSFLLFCKKNQLTLGAGSDFEAELNGKEIISFYELRFFLCFFALKTRNLKDKSTGGILLIIIHFSKLCYVRRSPGRYLFKRLFC